jgi:hypothetical protein
MTPSYKFVHTEQIHLFLKEVIYMIKKGKSFELYMKPIFG